jgi:hypothetical protein
MIENDPTKKEEHGPSKLFDGVLMINWKTGSMRVFRRKTRSANPWEIPIKLMITVNMPPQIKIVAKGEITVPEVKAQMMTIEAL